MALPRPGKTEWPPPSMKTADARYRVLSAWYGGDPDVLERTYDGGGSSQLDVKYRAAQYRGGLVGSVARWFWGAPPPAGETRTKYHIPAASDLATLSSDLLFSEPPKITFEDDATQQRITRILDRTGAQATLIEGAEVAAAIGDVYLSIAWDTTVRDSPWIRVIHGDSVVPTWRSGVLVAATIWTVLEQEPGGTVWRHLEHHTPGLIEHGLYAGTSATLGRLAELDERPETAHLTAQAATGVDRLLVWHVPNMCPLREDRGSPLGRSDFGPATLGIMDGLDEVWTSLMREFRLAKARAVVTEDAVRPLGPGKGVRADIDREIFVPIRVNPEHVTDPVRLIQPLLRVEEHARAASLIFESVCRSAGYSPGSFGGQGSASVALTATEARGREVASYRTRDKKALYWSAALRGALAGLVDVDNVVFGSRITPSDPVVELGDAVVESTDTIAQTLAQLAQARSASVESRVRILHPTWDDPMVSEEVARIHAEEGIGPVPDPEQTVTQP